MSRGRRTLLLAAAVAVPLGAALLYRGGRSLWYPVYARVIGARTVADVLERYGSEARARLAPRFEAAGGPYPPERITLVGLKEERRLELWTGGEGERRFVHAWPVLAASGGPGPKLREGDRQVPEGVYRIVALNPNSSYHLSLKLDYPSAFDRSMAERDGRVDLGSNIFVHGKARSIGCLAIGDPAIEELFVLAADAGLEHARVLLAPRDPREHALRAPPGAPDWTTELYATLEREIADCAR